MATNSQRAVQQLGNLRSAGVDVALDDFGSVYSNLPYIAHIPADALKIDQSFVRPLKEAGDDDFLLCHIISIARGLASASAPRALKPHMPMHGFVNSAARKARATSWPGPCRPTGCSTGSTPATSRAYRSSPD